MRNAAFLAVGILFILVQAQLYRVLGVLHLHGATPSLVLPLVIFLGVQEHSMPRGAFLAFVLGYVLDLLGTAPLFLFTFVFVAVWALARVAGVRLTAQTVLTRFSLGFVFSIVESAIVLVLLAIFGADTRRPLDIASIILPRALATAACAPLVFRLAQRLHQAGQPTHAPADAPAR